MKIRYVNTEKTIGKLFIRCTVFLLLLLISAVSFARNEQTITVQGHSIRGENDTRQQAIERAFQDAQWKAARRAGEFVHVEEILLDYNIDDQLRSEYINSISVISPTVLQEVSMDVETIYDDLIQAERYVVTVTYVFDKNEMDRRVRSFVANYKSHRLELLNDLMLQYSRRLDMLDSLLALGETETAQYISLFTEASGIYGIISKDVKIRGREISKIIENENVIYLSLIDLYIDRLDDMFRNLYHHDKPQILDSRFLGSYDVRKKRRYLVKYNINWGWDNQYITEILHVMAIIEKQIPIQYQPYLSAKIKRIDRKYKDVDISITSSRVNKLDIKLRYPYYSVFLELKNRRGRVIDSKVLRDAPVKTSIVDINTNNHSNEITITGRQNKRLQYMNLKYEPYYLFSYRFGMMVNVRYDYITTDTSDVFRIKYDMDPYQYIGLSCSGFLNMNLRLPNNKLDASRLRLGLSLNITSNHFSDFFDNEMIYTLSPVIAYEYAKIRNNSHRGIGFMFAPRNKYKWGKKLFPETDLNFQKINEFSVYMIYNGLRVGLSYQALFENELKGYGVSLGYAIR